MTAGFSSIKIVSSPEHAESLQSAIHTLMKLFRVGTLVIAAIILHGVGCEIR